MRRNRYDEVEVEYWVDVRTIGSKGTRERTGMRDTTSATGSTAGIPDSTQNADLGSWRFEESGVCQVETGKDKAPGARSM